MFVNAPPAKTRPSAWIAIERTLWFAFGLKESTGAADSFNPNANQSVLSIAIQADGRVLAGGAFTNISGHTRNHIARLNATSGLADAFNPNAADGNVRSIAVQADGKILAGGAFTTPRNRIARLETDGRLDRTLDPFI